MDDMTLKEARGLLSEWARLRDELDKRRDPLVRACIGSGMQKAEIARIMGLARTTVDRIAAAS